MTGKFLLLEDDSGFCSSSNHPWWVLRVTRDVLEHTPTPLPRTLPRWECVDQDCVMSPQCWGCLYLDLERVTGPWTSTYQPDKDGRGPEAPGGDQIQLVMGGLLDQTRIVFDLKMNSHHVCSNKNFFSIVNFVVKLRLFSQVSSKRGDLVEASLGGIFSLFFCRVFRRVWFSFGVAQTVWQAEQRWRRLQKLWAAFTGERGGPNQTGSTSQTPRTWLRFIKKKTPTCCLAFTSKEVF